MHRACQIHDRKGSALGPGCTRAALDSAMRDEQVIKHPGALTIGDFTQASDPIALFGQWMAEATAAEPIADAASLATVDADGLPNARMVLIKAADDRGFVFYTHVDSVKGRELASRPEAALVVYWKSLGRQIRARGKIERVSEAEADAYFASRPRGAQIGAWASRQSRPKCIRPRWKEIWAPPGSRRSAIWPSACRCSHVPPSSSTSETRSLRPSQRQAARWRVPTARRRCWE